MLLLVRKMYRLFFQYSVGDATLMRDVVQMQAAYPFNTPLEMQEGTHTLGLNGLA